MYGVTFVCFGFVFVPFADGGQVETKYKCFISAWRPSDNETKTKHKKVYNAVHINASFVYYTKVYRGTKRI